MKRILNLFICTTSLLVGATLPALAGIAECPVLRSEKPLEAPKLLDDIFNGATASYGSPNKWPYLNNEAMDEEGPAGQMLQKIFENRHVNIPMPVVRFEPAGSSAKVELPSGDLRLPIDRWPCILAPGDEVFLSDGFTDHATLIYRIQADRKLVTFIDARAEENFLLSENSLLQDFGGHWFVEGDRKLFSVPFDTMDSVLKAAVLVPPIDGKVMIETVAALAPGVARLDLYYWRDANMYADMDASQPVGDNGYLFGPQKSPLIDDLGFYNMAVLALTGQDPDLALMMEVGFEKLVLSLPQTLSRNLNFRLLYELINAGELTRANNLAHRYLEVRGFDADFAVIGAAVCHELGDSACAEDLRTRARAELDPRLGRMFRGETFAEDRALLDRHDYENASIFLMRRRYEMLESW